VAERAVSFAFEADAEFVCAMEEVLQVYQRPDDLRRAVGDSGRPVVVESLRS
jgi:hypothetical protein